jgi:hypothetical protein
MNEEMLLICFLMFIVGCFVFKMANNQSCLVEGQAIDKPDNNPCAACHNKCFDKCQKLLHPDNSQTLPPTQPTSTGLYVPPDPRPYHPMGGRGGGSRR